ncbi:type 1 glutamine amidotransferase domain-containing protein [Nocardia huaxiensis]|uniref:Type 1 glutamine amidotransferase domain-containing protein n=1 Tax=Nocardia huaxiensis TaxID=2755382 RepID=A0A7D6V8X8_9NOCA|nr:type 1 glutamine amidotransferase domain-containing protein [Nocardia huaxiensis]QLY30541.1 type 1 glutamine amidotransferase domain-containing protein [Nocardia huaxiensis]
MAKILFVMTGVDYWTLADGSKHPTGYWAEEFAAPYEAFTGAGHEIVVATPGGVTPAVDRASLAADVNGGPEGAEKIAALLKRATELASPIRLEDVALGDYDAVYYPGGHGPMEDLAVNADSGRLLTDALASGKPLGVVCHAPAALLATTGADGSSPFAGYRITGFTNAEETQAGWADKAKWLLQDRLEALGADFRVGEPWAPHIEVDRNLYTGQNPASSAPLATELLKAL